MKFYCLRILPEIGEGEGANCDEWFSSLDAARARRTALLRIGEPDSEDYAIDEIEMSVELPPKQLLLAVLNRFGFARTRRTVVAGYVPKQEQPNL